MRKTKKPTTCFQIIGFINVPGAGLEPARPDGHRIFLPTTTFAATCTMQVFVVWTIPSPWINLFRRPPSSLYTFFDKKIPKLGSGLPFLRSRREVSPNLRDSTAKVSFCALKFYFKSCVSTDSTIWAVVCRALLPCL